jgi:hypothetical protein
MRLSRADTYGEMRQVFFGSERLLKEPRGRERTR